VTHKVHSGTLAKCKEQSLLQNTSLVYKSLLALLLVTTTIVVVVVVLLLLMMMMTMSRP
jgi:hypothetical protein